MVDREEPFEDKVFVQRAQAGDTRAFDRLVVEYSPRLYGLIYNMTSNHEDTNDLLQDVFAKAYRSLKGFKGKSSFYTWVYTIAVNMSINFLKKRNRYRKMSLDDVDSGINHDKEFLEVTSSRSLLRDVSISEFQQKLNSAMMQLSEDHRAVVTMFDIQGMPHAEISKILGVSEGTVRSRLHYAHRHLQSLLSEFKNQVTADQSPD